MSTPIHPSSAPIYFICIFSRMFSPLLIPIGPGLLQCSTPLPYWFPQSAAPPLHHFCLFPLALDPQIRPFSHYLNLCPESKIVLVSGVCSRLYKWLSDFHTKTSPLPLSSAILARVLRTLKALVALWDLLKCTGTGKPKHITGTTPVQEQHSNPTEPRR